MTYIAHRLLLYIEYTVIVNHKLTNIKLTCSIFINYIYIYIFVNVVLLELAHVQNLSNSAVTRTNVCIKTIHNTKLYIY